MPLPALEDIAAHTGSTQPIEGLTRIETSTREKATPIIMEMMHSVYPHDEVFGQYITINDYIERNWETIRTDLVVFLALFADLATIAVAYDNAHYELRPVEWQLPKIWLISVVLGSILALSTWVMRGSFYLPDEGMVQNFGNIQLMLFLQVSLVEKQHKRQGTVLRLDPLAQRKCDIKGRRTGPICHKHVSRGAAKIRIERHFQSPVTERDRGRAFRAGN